jgi:hypothetical protein
MRPLLLRLSVLLLITLCLLVGAAQVVGGFRQHPAAAIIRQFECEPQPCWAGIHPGVTPLAEAERILSADPTFSLIERRPTDAALCWNWLPQWHHPVGYRWDGCYSFEARGFSLFMNYKDNGLRLGDVLTLLGRPSTSRLCTDLRIGAIELRGLSIAVEVPDNRMHVTPDLLVTQITYFSDDRSTRPMNDGWAGFSRWADVSNNCNAA